MAAAAGDSGTPLPKKLGIKAGHRVGIFGAPDGFALDLPDGASSSTVARGTFDVLVSFHTARTDLEARIPKLLEVLDVDGGLWVAWPKKAAAKTHGITSDLTEDIQREIWLPLGLVDVKVCAIDDVWSGLRLCWRKELRADVRAGRLP
jgi:hypothetical protein